MGWPYYTEASHTRGPITDTSGNGARDTSIYNTEGLLVKDMSDKIFCLDVGVNPFSQLLVSAGKTMENGTIKGTGMLKKKALQPKFEEAEDTLNGRWAKLSATYSSSGGVTVSVTNAGTNSGYIFTPGDVIYNVTSGERMLVATVSTTSITVASAGRAFGSTAAAAGAVGDDILIIGNVNEQGGSARYSNTTVIDTKYNYCQIFRDTLNITNTAKASELYTGSDLIYQRTKKGIEHSRSIELAFLFGERKSDTGGTQGKPRYATGGVKEFIEGGGSFIQNQNYNAITAPDMNTFMREGFTYGNNTKLLLAGGIVVDALSEISRGQLVTSAADKTYGVVINKWNSPSGTVNIVKHPLLVNAFAGFAFLLDMECFKYRFLRETALLMNRQANDLDGQADEYLTETGLERVGAARCAILKNVV